MPFENLIPLRRWNTHVLPPFVGVGRFEARSGTTLKAALPPAFWNATQPVVGGLEELPVLEGVVDLRIDRAGGCLRQQLERAAAVVLRGSGAVCLLRAGGGS